MAHAAVRATAPNARAHGSGAVGSFAGGVGYDLTGSYTVVALALAAVSLLGVVASVAAVPPSEPVMDPGSAPA